MKLYTLIENTTADASLTAEHGLSFYIQAGGMHLLFDTGATGAFVQNARQLGLDLSKVDAVILSHGHYDHGGGLEAFLECNDHAPVYLSSHAFGDYYNGSGKYIGLPAALRNHPRLVPVEDGLALTPQIRLDCCRGAVPVVPMESHGLQVREDEHLRPDGFEHELYLLIREGETTVCFSGCAHRGAENIVSWLRPQVLIGGFHFKQLEPRDPRLTRAARNLLSYPCQYYTCHCTGQSQYEALKEQMGPRLSYLSTGSTLVIPAEAPAPSSESETQN